MNFMKLLGRNSPFGLTVPYGLLIALSLCSSPVWAADNDELRKEFIDQYPAALQRLKKAVWNLHYEAKFTDNSNNYQVKGWIDSASEFEKGERAALLGKGSVAVESLCESTSRGIAAFVYCATPKYTFNLDKAYRDSQYLIRYYGNDPAKIETNRLLSGTYCSNIAFAAFQLYDLPIDHLLNEPSFKIESLRKFTRDEEELIEVRFELPNSELWYESGRWVVSPADDWAVREYEVIMRSSTVNGVPWIDTGKIGYQRIANKSVFPKTIQVTRSHSLPGKERIHEKEITHIDKVSFDTVSEANFQLPAFGVPNVPMDGTWNRYLMILAFVLAAVVFGVLYRRLNK